MRYIMLCCGHLPRRGTTPLPFASCSLLSKHLPPKLLQVVCVKLSPLQQQLYDHFLSSKELDLIMSGSQKGVLSSITGALQLCRVDLGARSPAQATALHQLHCCFAGAPFVQPCASW